MTGFILKVKTEYGQDILTTLGPRSTLKDLKQELSKITGIPIDSLQVVSGFPPEPKERETLQSNNISSGDILVVREKYTQYNDSPNNNCQRKNSFLNEDKNFTMEHVYQNLHDPGVLVKKTVPPDNSCLFTSIGFALSGELNLDCATSMRKIIAESVANDPETYNEAILGQPNKDYCEWIQEPTSWGGAIELAIMSEFYGVEIVVLDSVNGILNRFGEDQSYDYRIFLFFDGTHYDPLYLDNFQDNTSIKPKTVFSRSDEKVLQDAASLAKEAKASRQFTDINKFNLQCLDCNIFLKGHAEAGRHAKETGHKNFDEV